MTKTSNPLRRPALARRSALWIAAALALLIGLIVLWPVHPRPDADPAAPVAIAGSKSPAAAGSITNIYAHNLRLHQGPNFRVYVQWLRGTLEPSHKRVTPSFDDPDSFYLNVTNGVMRANMGDICNYLNARTADAPLKEIQMTGNGSEVKITGKFHKMFAVPVELSGVVMPAAHNRIQIHVNKINVLKIPFKKLLGDFHMTLSSFMSSGKITGVEVDGNDIYFDAEQLLPPPHIRGALTKVSIGDPDLEATYGDAAKDIEKVEQWRNFLRLENGTLNFGKLTMTKVDLVMVDISQDAWFDLDLPNYQAQLVKGYTRMTPQAGLQIFMPDAKDSAPINIDWVKDRNATPPAAVIPSKK